MIDDEVEGLKSLLLDTVTEEEEGDQTSNELNQINEKTKDKSSGLMGPPLFPPTRIEARNGRRSSSNFSSESSEVSSDSFETQPPLPNGQYSFITARYRAQVEVNSHSNTLNGSISSQIQAGSFTKSHSSLPASTSSKALTKGIQLVPVGIYNNNVGTRRMQELQMPDFKALQSRIHTPKAVCDQNKVASQYCSLQLRNDSQSRRHKALKHWWDAETQGERSHKSGKPLCAKHGVSPSDTINNVQDSYDDGIREGFVPYTPNKFFEPPQHIGPREAAPPASPLAKKGEKIRSRLLWEAVQDGLVTLDTILGLPLDWEDICLEHYQNIGLISPSDSTTHDKAKGTLASIYPIENPLTIKAKQVMKANSKDENKHSTTLLHKGQKAKIMLQYTK